MRRLYALRLALALAYKLGSLGDVANRAGFRFGYRLGWLLAGYWRPQR